ncbi:DUF6193 family natural product biosynthesis protein [Streptomyces sp. CA2R101]|uniref:DUF6193 family natural product biosynthesis protein n=1 Tax=Streptomyces sp. CA2R101 TaxID=3120152 RepID=UPI00300893BD
MAAARSRGPADVVEAHWQSLRLSWQWIRAVHQIRRPGRPYPGIVPLLEAAAAQPRLRRLYPFTSHFALFFSSSVSYPWTVQAGSIEPLHNGRFKVRRRSPSAVIGDVETAEEAVALLLDLLPTGPEPVITAPADGTCGGVSPHHTTPLPSRSTDPPPQQEPSEAPWPGERESRRP